MSAPECEQQRVTSADGTSIAVTITGRGRPLVVCHGSLSTRDQWQPFANALSPHMSTYVLDRRGRGDSGDGPEFSIEREQEDLAAVLDLAGPDAILLGHSYGGVVALSLALERPPAALVLYEAPLAVHGSVAGDALGPYEQAVSERDLDRALELGLRGFVGMPAEQVAALRGSPAWAARAALTPTWPREIRAIDAYGADLGRLAGLRSPTLFVTGELSTTWLLDISRRIHESTPDSRAVSLPGQAHDAHATAPDELAAALLEFILESRPGQDS